MKKRFTFLLAALLLMSGLTWAQTAINWIASEQGYTNAQVIESVSFDNNVSGTFNKGTNSNAPKYYNTGAAIRCYGGNYFTITSDYDLTQISLDFASGEGTNAITTNTGTYENGIWTGNATEVTFTIGGSSGHRRIASFEITYSTGGNPICATPTFSPAGGTYTEAQNVEIYCNTEGATIYYTLDGSDPTTSSLDYSSAIAIEETTTIKAIAVADNHNNSNVATATYTIISFDHEGTEADPYSVADAHTAIDAGTGTQGVYATGIVSEIVTEYSTQYSNITFDIVDAEGDEVYLRAYRCGGEEAANVAVGDIAVVYGNLTKYNEIYEFSQDCQLVSLTHPVVIEPSITVTPATVTAPVGGSDGVLNVTYENITTVAAEIAWYEATGAPLQDGYDWIDAEIDADNNVYYVINANNGEARTAYLKVWAYDDDDLNEVYSNLVTIEQDEYVAPTYATLPFAFNDGKTDIEGTDGLYQEGLGSDYNANNNPTTKLKFDSAGDWLLLQFSERPGTLTFDIKGNSFSGGTFKVQTSEDGVTYTDLESYTTLDDTQSEEFTNLGENVRYIKWIYTEKSSGNVGLGNISLTKYEAPQPAITLNSYSIEATAEETEGTLTVTYTEIVTDLDPEIYWFESDGVTAASEPDWMFAEINTDLNVEYLIEENEGEARTAYFKVYGVGTDESVVHSDLVTVSQAAAPQQYTLTVALFENLELITFVNDEMVLETAGTINVYEGDNIMLSVVADDGYVMETLMVNGVNHVNDIAYDFTYTFDMPAENVTIIATAVENVAPAAGYYVRITSLDQLTDESKVIIAARYDEEHTNGYYAMPGVTSGKPTGVAFESETSGNNEIIPATITASEDTYYWTVNVTSDSYTFTNANGDLIGYYSSSNFYTGNNTGWEITNETSGEGTMVPDYTGFVITNVNNDGRAFALNASHRFGPYAKSNMTNMNGAQADYFNFYLDIFVQSEAPVTETYTIDNITGYSGEKDHYYLIASPVTVNPENVEGMTTGDFDLYYFDQAASDGKEWRNYETQPFNLVPGKGYLYAKKATQETSEYSFTLTGVPYDGNGEIELTNTTDADFEGWHLVGNPFGNAATISQSYYAMNEQGDGFEPKTQNDQVAVMQGVFVYSEESSTVTFTEIQQAPAEPEANMILNVTKDRGNVIDRAIVRFGQSDQLPKFQLNTESTKLYIPQGNNDYAIVCSDAQGEMPVNFKAQNNGTYTISINAENVEMEYLHLIDNMTGADIDLLATPSYTFDAKATDYANRFRLVFSANNVNDDTTSETFAFFNGSEWSISNTGRATLQVVDVLGRIVSSESINGNTTLSTTNLKDGVYMFRLVNGENVKVQKVVVK